MEERRVLNRNVEGLDEYRRSVYSFLSRAVSFITDAPDCQIAAWQVSFALGLDNCIGQTMSSKAQEIGVSTACLSKGATKVCRMLELPPSAWMLCESARREYRDLRSKQEKQRLLFNRNGDVVAVLEYDDEKPRNRRKAGRKAR